MRKKNKKPLRRKIVLRQPDLDHAKNSVLSSLSSPNSRRNYRFAMDSIHHLVLFRAATAHGRSSPNTSSLPFLPAVDRDYLPRGSFAAKRLDRVDACCSLRGDHGSDQRRQCKKHSRSCQQ